MKVFFLTLLFSLIRMFLSVADIDFNEFGEKVPRRIVKRQTQ